MIPNFTQSLDESNNRIPTYNGRKLGECFVCSGFTRFNKSCRTSAVNHCSSSRLTTSSFACTIYRGTCFKRLCSFAFSNDLITRILCRCTMKYTSCFVKGEVGAVSRSSWVRITRDRYSSYIASEIRPTRISLCKRLNTPGARTLTPRLTTRSMERQSINPWWPSTCLLRFC